MKAWTIETNGRELAVSDKDAIENGYLNGEIYEDVKVSVYATSKSETNVADKVLHYKRTFEIEDVLVRTEKLAEVRDFQQLVAADQQSSVVLKKPRPDRLKSPA